MKLIKMGFDGNAEHCLALIDIFISSYDEGQPELDSPQDSTPNNSNDLGCHVKDTFTQVKSSFEFLK